MANFTLQDRQPNKKGGSGGGGTDSTRRRRSRRKRLDITSLSRTPCQY
jgi:hypothetical protein